MRTLAQLQATEAQRRRILLGAAIENTREDTGEDQFRTRARQTGVPVSVLRHWHSIYLHGGLNALVPTNWPEPSQISEATWTLIEQRYASLGDLAEAEIVNREDIQMLAAKQGWTVAQAQRLLNRYRTGGILGLAPMKRTTALPIERKIPDLGSLSEERRTELFRRHALLGELAEQERVSNITLAERAGAVGVSLRTLRDYHTRFRRDGLIGLATRPRIDKGKHHALSSQMTQVVESLRLTMRDATIRSVYERACECAATIGEMAPSIHQVRAICAQIPAPVRLLADGREEEFRNRYRLTYPIRHDPNRIIWQIDHKAPLHIMVRDLRAPSHRSPSGEVRPFLTLVMDSASRLVMAGLFSYDHPNRFMVAAAIRDAMLTCEQKRFGGVPDEIWVDNGKDLIAHHVYQLAQGLGVNLVAGPPHEPQVRGIVERFHETLDTRLWSTLPGYVGANILVRNPHAKAELTLAELDQHFRAFIQRYHQEIHSVTGQTPLAFWQKHASPLPVDERLLDVLLKEPSNRRVLKDGIKYGGQRYWHPELGLLVGEDVLVRVAPHYAAPDELEVFFEGQWRCTAFSLSSATGQTLQREVVVEAQRSQRASARRRIKGAKEISETLEAREKVARPRSTLAQQTKSRLTDKPRTERGGGGGGGGASEDALPVPAIEAPDVPSPHVSYSVSPRTPDIFDFLIAKQAMTEGSQQGGTK